MKKVKFTVWVYVMRNDYTTFTREFDYANHEEAKITANKYSNFLCELVNAKCMKDYQVEIRKINY